MDKAIITNDFFGILTLLVILYGSIFKSKDNTPRKKAFIILVSAVILSLATDALGYLYLLWADKYKMQFLMLLLSHSFPFVVYIVFMHYIYLHILKRTENRISKVPFIIGISYCIVGVFSALFYGIQNKIFVIDNGKFCTGQFYRGYLLTYFVILVYVILIVLLNCKKLGMNDSVASIMFMAVPLFFVVLNLNYYELKFSITSLSISMLIINTVLNAEREQSLIYNEAVSVKMAHSDELTGLYNRLAFSRQCETMTGETMTGVVFADVNGLKYTNDNLGHKAGDDLLCRFTEILLSCFRKSDIYRISGDEFVVLLGGVPKDIFESKVDMLGRKIKECEVPIAAYGAVYGRESDVNGLLEQAENKMYIQKKIFYEEFPAFKR